MSKDPTSKDFCELKALYETAVKDRDAIQWTGDYPEYPSSVSKLMRYVTTSPWCNPDYQPTETEGILGRLPTATLLEVRSALTAMSRSERFCTGSWKSLIEGNKMSAVIARAQELT